MYWGHPGGTDPRLRKLKQFLIRRSERWDDFTPLKGHHLMPVAWDTTLSCNVVVLIVKALGEDDDERDSDDEESEDSEDSSDDSDEDSDSDSDSEDDSDEDSDSSDSDSDSDDTSESDVKDEDKMAIDGKGKGKARIGKADKPLVVAREAAAGKAASASTNTNVVRRNKAIVAWLEDLYEDDSTISAIRNSTPKEAVTVSMLRDQILKVEELVQAHHKQFPTPRNALQDEFYFKRVTMEHLASLLKRGTNWMRQCVSAAQLMKTKGQVNATVKKYLTTDDDTTKFGVTSFLNYLKTL
jgi:hypothetical protein